MPRGEGDAVVDRAFRLLDVFSAAGSELGLDELARASGLARSTAHRLAAQLTEVGALERTKRGWRLGARLFELGQTVPRHQRLRDAAIPHMEDLYEATHETVQLAVLDGAEVVYVEILCGHHKVPSPARRGGRMPAHCTAVGKALLAFSAERREEAEPALARRTQHTVIDPRAMRRELQVVRRNGLAYDRQEAQAGLTCVAAPVFGRDGTPIAAVSVSMHAAGPVTVADAAPVVRTAGGLLTRQLRLRGSF